MSAKLDIIHAHEILDSRGNPTVHVTVVLKNGLHASASVPSGASVGIHEAQELRDHDPQRYRGLGVRKAVRHVNGSIALALRGKHVDDLPALDAALCELDGTPNKRRLGANAILGVSLACARVAAKVERLPLYAFLRHAFDFSFPDWRLPTPMMNVINGGLHADSLLDIQEFLLLPTRPRTFAKKLQAGSEIFHTLGDLLAADGWDTDVGNEGGYGPEMRSPDAALQMLVRAIRRAGYMPGRDVFLGLDVAASEYYDERTQRYTFPHERRRMTAQQLVARYCAWKDEYPLLSIEDGLAQDAWEDWEVMTARLKKELILVGDDLFTTNVERLTRGITDGVANAILIKPNQIGTLSETMETIRTAQQHKYRVILSHRSGETTDTTIADIAVAVRADFLKSGAPSRSERLCKYNRLLEIEEEITQVLQQR